MNVHIRKHRGVTIDEASIREIAQDTLDRAKEEDGKLTYCTTGNLMVVATYYDGYPEVYICKIDRVGRKDISDCETTLIWED